MALELIAYYAGRRPRMQIAPAGRWREWMSNTEGGWANRCLPLLMANEAGWFLLNPEPFTATWDGGEKPDSLRIEFASTATSSAAPFVCSHFGHGILSWGVPYLFRTPEGFDLTVRGPSNWPKDGATALDGLVEADWAVSTFTMNWKLTRPGLPVSFAAGEPFCMIVPSRKGQLESFEPSRRRLDDTPELHEQVKRWSERRHRVQVVKFAADSDPSASEAHKYWEGDYFRGRYPDGSTAAGHRTKQRLRPFVDVAGDLVADRAEPITSE